MFQLAVEASNQGDTAEAVRIFRLLARDAPNDPLTLCNLGTALMRHGNGPAARPEWERVYSEALRIYLRALAINPSLQDGISGYDLVKKNVHIRMDLSGGSAAEADAVIAMASDPADDSFVDASAAGLPSNHLGSFSRGDDDDDDDDGDDEWDDDFDDDDDGGSVGRPGTKETGGAERDAMHSFLARCGLSKYYDALYNYGIDDLDFLLEIEAFDMEYISMSKVDQKTLLAAIASGGASAPPPPAGGDRARSSAAVGSDGSVDAPATEAPATPAAAGRRQSQSGDAMHTFLRKIDLAKYYDALYSYGIDDLDFLLEIEQFDMECVPSLPPLFSRQSSRPAHTEA